MIVDVVIIGSGPAACAAAITLRQYRLHTLIITKSKKHAGEEQPSESIHPGVGSILAKLNASSCIEVASRGVYEGIQTGNHYTPLGADENGAWLGTHISRSVFDKELLHYAESHGAEIVYDDAVEDMIVENNRVAGVQTACGNLIPCRYVLDASGYKRIAGMKLNFKEDFFSPPLVAWSGVSECDAGDPLFVNRIARFLPHSNGWTWLAPEPPGRCTWTRLAVKGKQQFLPPDELKNYPLAGKIKVANRRWRIFRPLCKEGIILCGDAAAIIDPSAGLGIFNALISGMAAAKTIVSSVSHPDYEAFYLANYDGWFLQHFTDKVQQLRKHYTDLGINLYD